MNRIVLLSLAMMFFSMNVPADNKADRLWRQVSEAEKEGKFQTAAEHLRKLEELALKDGDELEQYFIAQKLLDDLGQFNWKERNAYYPVYSGLRKNLIYDNLERSIEKYAGHKRIMILLYERLLNRKAQIDRKSSRSGTDYLTFKEECQELVRQYPSSSYAPKIKAIVEGMDSQSFYTNSLGPMAPTTGAEFVTNVRNVSKMTVTVHRMKDNVNPEKENVRNMSDFLSKNAAIISQQTYSNFKNEYNISEEMPIYVDFPVTGIYVVQFKYGSQSAFEQVYVTNVASAVRSREGRAEVYAADLTSGKPLEKFNATIYRNNNYKDRKTFAADGFTDLKIDGLVSDRNNFYSARIEAEGDIYAPELHINRSYRYNTDEDNALTPGIAVFTDRSLYRSDDTIHFKLICYRSNRTQGQVEANRKVEVLLRHNSGKDTVASVRLVTNEMGSASGIFTLPQGSRNGVYSIFADGVWAASFRVETYVRPNFSVNLNPVSSIVAYGDVVTQTGILKSYAGYPVAGASVEYEIQRFTFDYNAESFLDKGKVVSDDNGIFEIPFLAERPDVEYDEQMPLFSTFQVSVKVTDPSGETHESSTSLPVSDIPVDIEIVLPGHSFFEDKLIVNKDNVKSVLINASTNNGTPCRMDGTYSIYRNETLIASDNFKSNEELDFDFGKLDSGLYRLEASCIFRGKEIKSSKDIAVMSFDDRTLPFKSVLFDYAIKTENAIEFVLGTSEEDLYLEMELFDGDKRHYREALHLQNEMRRIVLPYRDYYRSEVILTLYGFRNGEEVKRTLEFIRPSDVKLELSIESFRDRTTPQTTETMTLKAPAGSELAVSIYDVTSDRYSENSFDFRPLNEHVYTWSPSVESFLRKRWTAYGYSRSKEINADMISLAATSALEAEEAIMEDSAEVESAAGIELRENFSELIGFFPHVTTDSSGKAQVSYTTPDLLSTFRVLVLGHDKDLKTGNAEGSFVVSKELMVIPHLPLFATEGDIIVLHSQIMNLSDREQNGTAHIEVLTEDGYKINGLDSKPLQLLAEAQANVSWPLEIPSGTDKLTVRIWFDTEKASDGEIHEMIVVPSSVTLTEAASFIIGDHTHKYYERMLRKQIGADNPSIEYAQYTTLDAVKEALPKPEKPSSENALDWINQLYIGQMRDLVNSSDENGPFRSEALVHIKSLQAENGGIRWFQGMDSNLDVTLYFLEKMGQLRANKAIRLSESENDVIRKALAYIDNSTVRLSSKETVGWSLVKLFSVRSLWFDFSLSKEVAELLSRTFNETQDNWQRRSILEKTELCNLMLRASGTEYRDSNTDSRIRVLKESLCDYAVQNPSVGCYFPNAVMPFRGLMNTEIYAHSQLIDLFTELNESKIVEGLTRWLLLQKHNQAWENTVATADAVHALIKSNAKDLKFGAVYYTYTTKLDKVQPVSNEIEVKRTYFRNGRQLQDGDRLNVGDDIIVEYTVRNSENRSFVRMKAARPAAFYPQDERSGYSRGGYYREVKENESLFYWELLPEENTIVRESFYVSQEGVFSSGLIQIESLFAPEYRGHTGSVKVTAE